MDLLQGKVKTIYFKYLTAAFGSALILSVYSLVDMAMVGQYHGAEGTAALAFVQPIWNIVYALGILMGIGGSVMFSMLRGQQGTDSKEAGEYFTCAVLGAVCFALVTWVAILFFQRPILLLFGGNEALLPLAESYLKPVRVVFPMFLFNQMLAAFLRNDNDPNLATIGVLAGGAFNIVGDYIFVFTFNLGAFGAGLATAIGAVITFLVLGFHFMSAKNTLRLQVPRKILVKLRRIFAAGFSSFFVDISMGILTILFNRQIMKYLDGNALAVYGIIINVSTFVQGCAYSIGQAAQPIISVNLGAGQGLRIRSTLRYALYAAVCLGAFWTILSLTYPGLYVRMFMTPTPEIMEIAPGILRAYCVSFALLPLNIFSTYYYIS